MGKACRMSAGVTISSRHILSPIHTSIFAFLSASSFPATPPWLFTHTSVRGFSVICQSMTRVLATSDCIFAVSLPGCQAPPHRTALTPCRPPISSASATVAIMPRYRPSIRIAPAPRSSIRLPSVHSSTASFFSSSTFTSRLPGADRRPRRRQSRRMDRRQQDR